MDYRPPRCSVHGVSQARILKCVASFLLQGIFLAQGWNPCLLHCRQILLPLSHLGGPIHSIVILNGRHYYLHFTDEETEAQRGELPAPIARTSVKCQSGRFHKKNINLSTITVYPKLGPNKRKGDLDSLCICLQQAEAQPTLVGVLISFPTAYFTSLLQLLDQSGSGRQEDRIVETYSWDRAEFESFFDFLLWRKVKGIITLCLNIPPSYDHSEDWKN